MAPQGKRKRDDGESPLSREDKTVQPAASSLDRNADEVSFPRGGASALTPLELKQVANEAANDVLFANESSKKKAENSAETGTSDQRKSKKKKVTKKTDDDNEDSEEDIDVTSVIVSHINFKNLKVGSQLLGQIKYITKEDICVTFADNISGYVPLTSISDQFTDILEQLDESMSDSSSDEEGEDEEEYESSDDVSSDKKPLAKKEVPNLRNYFKIGQWLRCSVSANTALETQSKKNKKKKILLSIEPSVVNILTEEDLNKSTTVQCSVKSIEDHGAALDLGIEGITGFISKKDYLNFDELKPGFVFLGNIAKKSGRSVVVNLNFSPKNKVSQISSIDAVIPGQSVDLLCESVQPTGITGKVYGLVPGFISNVHLHTFDREEIKHKYAIGSNVQGRILASLNNKNGDKVLIISTLPHITSLENKLHEIENLEAFPFGYTFDSASIKGRDSEYLYLALDEDRIGEVHHSKIGNAFESEKISARVLGYNSIDNVFQLSTDPETLKLKYVRAADIKIGELLTGCEIVSVSSKGIQLKIFNNQFSAFVPPIHISDTRLVYPERKFKIGSKIKGRVLSVDFRGHILVTLKKTLVNAEENETPLLDSYKAAQTIKDSNSKTTATVQYFKPNGCVVSFFGGISGFLPNTEISEAFVKRPEEHLRLGQTILVKLLQVEKERSRIIVTCKVSNDKADSQKETIEKLIPGKSFVEASVIEKTKDSLVVEMEKTGLRGVVYVGHLSDLRIEQNRAEIKKVRIGSKLNGLVIDKDTRTYIFNMTLKESLIKDAKEGKLPTSYSEVKTLDKSTPLHGYVKSVSDKGIFVAFNGKFVGLVLPSYAVENREIDFKKSFYMNQSVTAYILRTDDEQERFLLTLKEPKTKEKKKTSTDTAAINPIDSSIKDLSDFRVGSIVEGKIKGVKKNQLNIILADNLHGRVDIAEVFDNFADIKDKQQPLSNFKSGDLIKVKILGHHDVKSYKFLPISHSNLKNSVLELSIKPSELKSSKINIPSIDEVKIDSELTGFINNFAKDCVWLTVSPILKAKLPLFELSDDGSRFSAIEDSFPLGTALRVHVTSVDKTHNFVTVSNRSKSVKSIDDVNVDDILPARIIKVNDNYVLLDLGHKITGISFITDALNDFSSSLHDEYDDKLNEMVSAKVISIDRETKKINLSLQNEKASNMKLKSHEDLKQKDVVKAIIKNVTEKGIFVYLSSALEAFVPVSKLSDSYLKDWKKFYKPMQSVIGKVISCDDNSHILLTLRESEVNGELKVLKGYSDIKVGDIFNGNIKNVTDFGVFVKLDNTVNVSGLAHRTEIADTVPENLSSIFGVGDRVKAIVLKTNPEKQQISLGLKASYFTSAKSKENSDSDLESDEDEVMADVNYNEESEDEAEIDDEEPKSSKTPMTTDGLSLSAGFDWTANILNQAQSDDDLEDEMEDFTEVKRSKHKRSKTKIIEDKTIDINARAPESVSDFERLIVGNPNSSVIWMNYMAFRLQLSEIDKAREIAERALKTINFREENEKLNIWIAMLNLENTFGTEETLEDVFKRSCQYMDSFTMHNKLLSIYQMSEKLDKAAELFKATSKKFGSEKVSVWVSWGEFLINNKQAQEARSVLASALKSLPKRNHVELVRKFAQLEFAKGDPERGRSLFEGLIADAPKRIDIWNVYIDQEIKIGEKKKAEDLFERVINRKITRKQAKFFFNKWLQFEESQNDEKTVSYVKAKATEFAENNPKASQTD
ncbi:hypothetical protein Kpol_1043p58 [Vanderwaltozyma polyspora DSM 70294]|uniref:mRNA 3'-end-processing protein RNA14 n=1 Tax=Vanderwaltozyma polyspora (strain ATCC 22028 / DSM 70294 / BCRC 21397 / CBS 2163 / NBRC 10782 / NRRL Y-8283 / UCD 57-17) TaxID=436907 RepID=A7TIS6_VANPO|nr:uncharacterized protein Kpol_1043p58 [Vanderwaltozyma polyspora DSM 70294]EDO17868.1 hypothetical protein Kpol_1043p58 [Vanderwaltozyma polyspora DSM 70294]